MNFTWWVNREDADGSNLFEGGFLGLDNIGPIDRDHLPVAGTLEQSDATAWMALYSLHMATMAVGAHRSSGQPTQDLTLKFLEHFALIRDALDDQGLWDETTASSTTASSWPTAPRIPIKVRSMVGVLPVLASVVIDEVLIERAETLGKGFAALLGRDRLRPRRDGRARAWCAASPATGRCSSAWSASTRSLGSSTGSSPRTSSSRPTACARCPQAHRDHPYELEIGELSASIDYEPAESTTNMFGGNSNWRGPIWFPLNYLLVSSIKVYGSSSATR